MMSTTPHTALGFRTQAAALAELKRILNAAPLRQPLTGADLHLVLRAITLHRRYRAIVGVGLTAVYVDRNAEYPNRCFHVRRTDDTVETFSYRACVVHKSRSAEVRTALRHAVEDQIRTWRATQPAPKTCSLCNTAADAYHVDHYRIPFTMLAGGWLQVAGLDDTTLEMAPKRPQDCTHRLADDALTAAWRHWHAIAIAQPDALRLICARCNLSRGAAC